MWMAPSRSSSAQQQTINTERHIPGIKAPYQLRTCHVLSLPRIHMCNQRPGARLKGLRFVMACVLVLAPMHTAPVAWLRSSVCPLLKIPPPLTHRSSQDTFT